MELTVEEFVAKLFDFLREEAEKKSQERLKKEVTQSTERGNYKKARDLLLLLETGSEELVKRLEEVKKSFLELLAEFGISEEKIPEHLFTERITKKTAGIPVTGPDQRHRVIVSTFGVGGKQPRQGEEELGRSMKMIKALTQKSGGNLTYSDCREAVLAVLAQEEVKLPDSKAVRKALALICSARRNIVRMLEETVKSAQKNGIPVESLRFALNIRLSSTRKKSVKLLYEDWMRDFGDLSVDEFVEGVLFRRKRESLKEESKRPPKEQLTMEVCIGQRLVDSTNLKRIASEMGILDLEAFFADKGGWVRERGQLQNVLSRSWQKAAKKRQGRKGALQITADVCKEAESLIRRIANGAEIEIHSGLLNCRLFYAVAREIKGNTAKIEKLLAIIFPTFTYATRLGLVLSPSEVQLA